MQITREILESFLLCKYKSYLQFNGHFAEKSEYELMLLESRNQVSTKVFGKILMRNEAEEISNNDSLSFKLLKMGFLYILNTSLHTKYVSLSFDGLKKEEGKSEIGNFHYIPLLFYENYNIKKNQRLLLDLYGLYISEIQDRLPRFGIVYCGRECRSRKISLFSNPSESKKLFAEINQLQKSNSAPAHILNSHCDICEFSQKCNEKALAEDNISLLRGIGKKEVNANRNKGIFTLTQFAYTFRPRRKGKRAQHSKKRHNALQAMAIRDKRVFVFGTPKLPTAPVKIYFDIEGIPDEKYVYLIGLIVDDGISEKRQSFWADSKSQEISIFNQLLSCVNKYDDYLLFCYGSYEKSFLKRMRAKSNRKKIVDQILSRLVNVLSLVYSHFYFPTYTNSLKEIGGYLGSSWSAKNASGIQSIVWRMNWITTLSDEWKRQLIEYNIEDCVALHTLSEFIYAVCRKSEEESRNNTHENEVAWIDEIDKLTSSSFANLKLTPLGPKR